MEIKEVKEKKKELETKIKGLLDDFCRETGVKIEDMGYRTNGGYVCGHTVIPRGSTVTVKVTL